jgi:hypothetical protein
MFNSRVLQYVQLLNALFPETHSRPFWPVILGLDFPHFLN